MQKGNVKNSPTQSAKIRFYFWLPVQKHRYSPTPFPSTTNFELCLSVLNRLGGYWVGLVSFNRSAALF